MCGQSSDLLNVKSVGTYTVRVQCYPYALMGTCTNCFIYVVQQYLQWFISYHSCTEATMLFVYILRKNLQNLEHFPKSYHTYFHDPTL